jgi:hypothetical protein
MTMSDQLKAEEIVLKARTKAFCAVVKGLARCSQNPTQYKNDVNEVAKLFEVTSQNLDDFLKKHDNVL